MFSCFHVLIIHNIYWNIKLYPTWLLQLIDHSSSLIQVMWELKILTQSFAYFFFNINWFERHYKKTLFLNWLTIFFKWFNSMWIQGLLLSFDKVNLVLITYLIWKFIRWTSNKHSKLHIFQIQTQDILNLSKIMQYIF